MLPIVNPVPSLFAFTLFLSATLLFLIQPMFARLILPLLGGTPAVWNTCVVFFQLTLLAGYIYAHLITKWLDVRRQALLQIGLLVLPLFVLPIGIGPGWSPPAAENPSGWLFRVLVVSVGLPFFVVSTSAPLLQRWFASTSHRSASDPYFLYAASNAGSLIALLAYPTLVEPALRLTTQRWVWTAGYVGLVALVMGCALTMWKMDQDRKEPAASPAATPAQARSRKSKRGAGSTQPPPAGIDGSGPVWTTRLRWLALALLPSSLMLSVTTHISTDIAAVPLMWVVPLSLYLLTFIFVFARRQLLPLRLMRLAMPAAIVLLACALITPNGSSASFLIPLHLLAFFVISMVCHGELAATRPSTAHLTEFYLWLSTGGAVGGLLTTFVAPRLFSSPTEYPLAVVLACLVIPDHAISREKSAPAWLLLRIAPALSTGLIALAIAYGGRNWQLPPGEFIRYALVFGLPLLICCSYWLSPIRFGTGIAGILLANAVITHDTGVLLVQRTFFGVHRVLDLGSMHMLVSGTTNHGAQASNPELRCEPLTYYHRTGPAGQLFESFTGPHAKSRIGVVGLGTGSLSGYATPGQTWTFFEINPAIEQIARHPGLFTYLRDCAKDATVILGDARLTLTRAGSGPFDVIVLDAFSSDAIPVHLMTREAFQLYLQKLSPKGILAFHITNRHLDLRPVMAALAETSGLLGLVQIDGNVTTAETEAGKLSSIWVVLARRREDLGDLAFDRRWQTLTEEGIPVWTDDYSDIFTLFTR